MATSLVLFLFLGISAGLCFFIAYLNKRHCLAGNFCKIFTVGFITAGVIDLFHSVAAITGYLDGANTRLIWLSSSFAIIQMLLLFSFMPLDFAKNLKYRDLYKIFVFPQGLFLLTVLAMSSLIQNNVFSIKALDFLYCSAFLFSWLILVPTKRFKMCFPHGVFNVFIFLGVAIHFIMGSFSDNGMDSAYLFASLLKIVQYSVLAVFVVNMLAHFELKKVRYD